MPVTGFLFHDIFLVAKQRAASYRRRRSKARAPARGGPWRFPPSGSAAPWRPATPAPASLHRRSFQPARLGHDARIGGVDAVNIGVDVAAIGLQRRRQRHRAGIRAAAAERGDPLVRARCPESRRPPRPGPGLMPFVQHLGFDRHRCGPSHASPKCGSGPASPARSAPARRWRRERRPAVRR